MINEIVISSDDEVKNIVFVFHGYGADNKDLLPVGQQFAHAVDGVEVHLVNGIEPCDEGIGRQWFPLVGDDIATWNSAFKERISIIESFIDEKLAEKKLTAQNAIFAGFSQGAMLSLGLGLKKDVKGIVAFSGLLLNPEECVTGRKTKVLLAHGALDEVIPISAMHMTEEALQNSDIDVSSVVSPNLHHAIDGYVLSKAVDFLKSL